LTEAEQACLFAIADILIPAVDAGLGAAQVRAYSELLDVAVSARTESFPRFEEGLALLAQVSDRITFETLREMSVSHPLQFEVISSVILGAYLLAPEVRAAIGQPGPTRRIAPLLEAADELASGILDPVIERGPIYVAADGM
jgi:hypothetical protein